MHNAYCASVGGREENNSERETQEEDQEKENERERERSGEGGGEVEERREGREVVASGQFLSYFPILFSSFAMLLFRFLFLFTEFIT